MLSLDSPRWGELKAASGQPARLIVEGLRQLALTPDESVIGDLVGAMCVNMDIESAAFAGVPHVVAVARKLPNQHPCQPGLWDIVGTVEAWRRPDALPPADILADYKEAIRDGARFVFHLLSIRGWARDDVLALLAALLALRGCLQPARVLQWADFRSEEEKYQEVVAECPACSEEIQVFPRDGVLLAQVSSEDRNDLNPPVSQVAPLEAVAPNPNLTSEDLVPERISVWLPQAAMLAGHDDLGRLLRAFCGAVACPSCGQRVRVLEDLMHRDMS